jgi:hypothetical protein
LEKVGGGFIVPTLGSGRGKDQYNDPRTQTEVEDHTNPRTIQRDTRYEEDGGRTYHCTNTKIGASGSNRATTGMGSRNTSHAEGYKMQIAQP